eukprot:3013436-Alexandrium_andersonii.AAC.1
MAILAQGLGCTRISGTGLSGPPGRSRVGLRGARGVRRVARLVPTDRGTPAGALGLRRSPRSAFHQNGR